MEMPFVTEPPVKPVFVQPAPAQARPAVAQNTTDFKTQKVVLTILSIISLSIGYLALTIGSAPALLIAIPAVAAGLLIGWKVLRMKDYNDPKELQKYRNEAAYQPLVNTAKEHGWDMMIQYGIPRQEDFNRLVADRVRHSRFQSGTIFKDYEFLKRVRDKLIGEGKQVELDIPHPSFFKAQFDAEVQRLTKSELFEKYEIAQLCKYRLLPESELNVYQNVYQKYLKEYEEGKAAAEKGFREDFSVTLAGYERAIMNMAIRGVDGYKWLENEINYINHMRSNPLTAIHPNMHFNHTGRLEAQFEARKSTLEILEQIQERRKDNLNRVEAEFDRAKEAINNSHLSF